MIMIITIIIIIIIIIQDFKNFKFLIILFNFIINYKLNFMIDWYYFMIVKKIKLFL